MNDFPSDSFRSIIMRLQNENIHLGNLYKNAVVLLILSALINAFLLISWLIEVATK